MNLNIRRAFINPLLISVAALSANPLFAESSQFGSWVAAPKLVGTWVGEPTLGQLGYIQTTYTFNKTGAFTAKRDFKSFCGMGAVKPDCVYFWHISEGRFETKNDVIWLTTTKTSAQQLREGEAAPIIRDETSKAPNVAQLNFTVDQKTLIFSDKRSGKSESFQRQVETLKK